MAKYYGFGERLGMAKYYGFGEWLGMAKYYGFGEREHKCCRISHNTTTNELIIFHQKEVTIVKCLL
jgi:hypothetical protein